MTATIEVKKLCKNFDNLQAVADISFSTAKGEIIALLGPNGAGKSTLMNMITGYLAPSDGEIFILGKSIKNHPLAAKTAIGFLSEGSPLYPDMTVAAFLNYMAELRGFSGKKKEERLQTVCKTANIENVLTQRIETLSKGYLRRVGFAQSIISNPQILLLDEPTDGLDPNQKEHIRNLIKQMGQNKTIIISTHLLEEAENISTRIILINKGKIMADGSLQDVLRQTHSRSLENAFKKLTAWENN